jgi:hypothetical protein
VIEKLATHEVKDVSELFNLVDKCARAVEGCACHSQPTPEAREVGKPEVDAAAQSSGKNKNRKKKKYNNNKPLAGAPTATAVTTTVGGSHGPHSDNRSCQPSDSDEGGPRCLVHKSWCHSAEECREIKKLVEQFYEQQPRHDSPPPH